MFLMFPLLIVVFVALALMCQLFVVEFCKSAKDEGPKEKKVIPVPLSIFGSTHSFIYSSQNTTQT